MPQTKGEANTSGASSSTPLSPTAQAVPTKRIMRQNSADTSAAAPAPRPPVLTRDALKHVFLCLPSPQDVARVMSVCKEWHSITLDTDLWLNYQVTLTRPEHYIPHYAFNVEVYNWYGAAGLAGCLSKERVTEESADCKRAVVGGYAHCSIPRVENLSANWCNVLDVVGAETREARRRKKQNAASQHGDENTREPSSASVDAEALGASTAASTQMGLAKPGAPNNAQRRHTSAPRQSEAIILAKIGAVAPSPLSALQQSTQGDRVLGAQQLVSHLRHCLLTLDLSGSCVGPDEMKELSGLTGLRSLNVSFNPLGPTTCQHMTALTRLSFLNAASCGLGCDGVQHLTALTQLQELDIATNVLGAPGAGRLGSMSHLVKLDISRNQLENVGVCKLSGLTNLQHLLLAGNRVDKDGLQVLKGLTSLRSLDLKSNPVTAAEAKNLYSDLTALTSVTF